MWLIYHNAGGSGWKYFFIVFFLLVMGSPATRISGSGSFFVCYILFRVEIEDGGRKAKVENGWLWKEVAWET